MPTINQDSQEQLANEIALEFTKLATLLEDNPTAYKLTYQINKRVIEYVCNARLLQANKPKEMVDL